MKVALVFNPFKYKVHEENIRIVQKYFGLFPPLSLAWVAGIVEQAGHEVIIIDARTLGLSKKETREMLQRYQPDVMGFMMTTYMFQDTLEWIRYLKEGVPVPVMVGGYNLRVYPKESITHDVIDFGVVEQAYFTVPALLCELEKETPDFSTVPGLAYKRGDEVAVTPHEQKVVFNDFPYPARHLLPNELYAEFPTEKRNFTVMVTSLGCPYQCNFCEAGSTPYNPRDPEKVVDEIQECYDRFGIREIDMFDYEFTGVRSRVVEICRLLQQKNLDLIWACRSRIDQVDEELLHEMHAAGCRRIYFGIESGSQDILNATNKGITLEQARATIQMARRLGIRTLGFFLVGAPGETKETIKKTVRYAKSLDLDYAQFSKCLAKPLTSLWKKMCAETGSDYWKEWILGNEVDRELPRPWTTLSNAEIDNLARKAYLGYYVRPVFLWRHLWQLKSWRECMRKVCAFFDMMFFQEKRAVKHNNFAAFNENDATLRDKAIRNLWNRIESASPTKQQKGHA